MALLRSSAPMLPRSPMLLSRMRRASGDFVVHVSLFIRQIRQIRPICYLPSFVAFSLSELVTTETLLLAMAMPEKTGLSTMPKNG